MPRTSSRGVKIWLCRDGDKKADYALSATKPMWVNGEWNFWAADRSHLHVIPTAIWEGAGGLRLTKGFRGGAAHLWVRVVTDLIRVEVPIINKENLP